MFHDLRSCARLMCLGLIAPLVLASASRAQAPTTLPASPPPGPIRSLSVDEAVSLALAQNLDLQVERLNPQISDVSIALARTVWTPAVSTTLTTAGRDAPANSFLSGAQEKLTS